MHTTVDIPNIHYQQALSQPHEDGRTTVPSTSLHGLSSSIRRAESSNIEIHIDTSLSLKHTRMHVHRVFYACMMDLSYVYGMYFVY